MCDPDAPPARMADPSDPTVAALADSLIGRAGWVCPGCVPTIEARLTMIEWTVTTRHTVGCTAIAWWLIDAPDRPPPGTGAPPATDPTDPSTTNEGEPT